MFIKLKFWWELRYYIILLVTFILPIYIANINAFVFLYIVTSVFKSSSTSEYSTSVAVNLILH